MPKSVTYNAVLITGYKHSDDGRSLIATYELGNSDGTKVTVQAMETVTYAIQPTDTNAQMIAGAVAQIFSQEGLTAGSDAAFGPDGSRLS